ncbi:hypothetical protein [Oceanobacillus sp. J11TS1]|uniref:hypothetical protein n=1 Tax=Oceanobacillus sp. J11TS1 TaxID=2807191 RepID=UPI001B2718DF|nr:hypothetical protein [Oceanobacillus sp. J11TS1]GIO23761.1 hypothetical protein J11TS1_23420 [Oceanobacillus sp. J11TS1]
MFKILILFAVLFIPLAIGSYWFVTFMSKKEGEEEKSYVRAIVACGLSLIITVVIMLFIFAFFGSVTIAKSLLGFQIDANTLFYIILIVVAYAFILDDIISVIVKYLFRTSLFTLAAMAIIRFILFYMIGIFFDLSQQTNSILAIVLLILFLAMDIYEVRDKKKKEEQR